MRHLGWAYNARGGRPVCPRCGAISVLELRDAYDRLTGRSQCVACGQAGATASRRWYRRTAGPAEDATPSDHGVLA